MQKAIIHTDTRVIRRLTVDENPVIADDESVVELTEDISLDGGFWKLDVENKKTKPTKKEVSDSQVDQDLVAEKVNEKITQRKAIIADIVKNGATFEKIQSYFSLIQD